jgi:hypothetical protein
MTDHALPATDDQTADWARPLYEGDIALLGDLAQAALSMALKIKDQADPDPVQAAMAFGRVARATRLTVLLRTDLIKALENRDRHMAYLATSGVSDERRQRRARIERIVDRVATEAHENGEDVKRQVRESVERLETDDIYDLMDRPVSELVALVCKDLGLDPDWPRLAQEAWAEAEMASGDVGWPLAEVLTPGVLIQSHYRPSG